MRGRVRFREKVLRQEEEAEEEGNSGKAQGKEGGGWQLENTQLRGNDRPAQWTKHGRRTFLTPFQ